MSGLENEYRPISCDYVDHIEHLATIKKVVAISYRDGDVVATSEEDLLITWKTEAGKEFLYTRNGLKIRLDQIVSIDGKELTKSC